jgi:hypothetical protein
VAVCSPAVVTVRWLGFKRVWRGSGEGEWPGVGSCVPSANLMLASIVPNAGAGAAMPISCCAPLTPLHLLLSVCG